jgi:hypothetical protein
MPLQVLGQVISGGPGSSCCDQNTDGNALENDESITAFSVAADVTVTVQLTTIALNNVRWYISDSPEPTPDDGWDACGFSSLFDKSFVIHVHTGSARPWEIQWQIDDSVYPKSGSGVHLGAHPRSSRWGGADRYLEGSVAEVVILQDAISAVDADCLFNYGSTQVGVCIPQEDLYGRDWFGTFLGGSRSRIASRDLSGKRTDLWDDNSTHTLAEAMDVCKAFCAADDYSYMGLQWSNECYCDNDYGGKGQGEDKECDADEDGKIECGTNTGDICSWRNAVFDLTTDSTDYIGCFKDNPGVTGATMYGDARISSDFGVHLDGRGDYITIDPLSQRGDGRDVYSSDGTFSLSFWFWKRECTTTGKFESLFSHQDNAGDMMNMPRADAQWMTYPTVIGSEEERLAWVASDPDITDPFCFGALKFSSDVYCPVLCVSAMYQCAPNCTL